MAVEDVGGTVLGNAMWMDIGDHQNKPDMASALVRRWVEVDGVSAVTELTTSAVALAVQQIAKEQDRITLSTGPATTRLTNEDCSPTGFHWAFRHLFAGGRYGSCRHRRRWQELVPAG